jgi:AsmA protein
LIGASGFKRLGLAVAVGVVAGVGGLVAASLLVPAESVRNAIKAEIRAVTGFDPVIRGDVAVSLFPWGTVSFDNVTLGDERSGETAFAAERLTARMRLLPLLAGQIEAADVSLVRPHIVVTYEPDGRSNWSGLVETLARNFRPDANRADRLMSFSEIRITDGTVVVRDDSHGIGETLSGVEMSLAWPSISRSFGATGRLIWRGEPLDASITLTDFFAALQGERSGLKVRLNGSPFKVAFDGHLSRVPTLKMEGTVSTGTASLRRALEWAGHKPIEIGGLGRFALKAQMSMMGSSVLLAGVNAELDGNTAEGVLSFTTDGRASMQGTLDAGEIDLTPYLSTVQLMRASERDWSEVPISLGGLTGLDLDLRLSAARMTVAHAKLGRTAIAASVRNGQVTVTIGESHAFGGLLKGTLAVAKSPAGAEVKSQLHFADIDLEPGLGELIGVRRLQGKGSLAFSLEASGNSVLALTRTVSGQATLSARQGALAGFNVEELLKRLERRPLSGSGEFRTGHTPFEQLTVVLKFTKGTVNVEQVHLDGAAVRLAMAGSASVPARNVDLTGTARLVTPTVTDSGSPFELPFMVTGPWDGPDIRPDIQTLIQRSQATAPLLDSIKDRKTREAVQSAIDRLTGASAAPTDRSPPAAVTPALAAPSTAPPAALDPASPKR